MRDTLILYAPGAGGNHVKNLLCLSEAYINSSELDITVYDATDRAPGEVWCVGGRNLQPRFFERIHANPDSRSVLIAHFGELAQNLEQMQSLKQPQLVILTLTQEPVRRGLEHRQKRLGQTIHPYWLDEELIWCYSQRMVQTYFGVPPQDCMELDIAEIWRDDFCHSTSLERLESFLGVQVPRTAADTLHQKWLRANF
jgi:hypothetical protein